MHSKRGFKMKGSRQMSINQTPNAKHLCTAHQGSTLWKERGLHKAEEERDTRRKVTVTREAPRLEKGIHKAKAMGRRLTATSEQKCSPPTQTQKPRAQSCEHNTRRTHIAAASAIQFPRQLRPPWVFLHCKRSSARILKESSVQPRSSRSTTEFLRESQHAAATSGVWLVVWLSKFMMSSI